MPNVSAFGGQAVLSTRASGSTIVEVVVVSIELWKASLDDS